MLIAAAINFSGLPLKVAVPKKFRKEKRMKILCLGDVVGRAGVLALKEKLPTLRKELGAEAVIVNGENASMGCGNGLSAEDASMIFEAGADVITGGNHSFRQKSVYTMLDDCPTLLRPANYPEENPGKGHTLLSLSGRVLLVINVAGRVNMDPCACPFETCRKILDFEKGNYDAVAVDFHAEATGEKFALGYDLRQRIQIFFGTHTHVPTADEQILGGSCGYITDLGMCGPGGSALGLNPEIIVRKMKTGMPCKFEPADTPAVLQGALFTLSDRDFKCQKVERIQR